MRSAPSDTVAAEDQRPAPLPILGEDVLALLEIRPSAATAAEYFAVFGVGICLLVPIAGIFMYFSGSLPPQPVSTVDEYLTESFVLPLGFAVVTLALAIALHRRKAIAWWCQLVLALLGLLAFPFGTVIYGLLLIGWFQRSTRVWFRISQR